MMAVRWISTSNMVTGYLAGARLIDHRPTEPGNKPTEFEITGCLGPMNSWLRRMHSREAGLLLDEVFPFHQRMALASTRCAQLDHAGSPRHIL